MNTRATLFSGALLALLGVGLGAFGAHALKPVLTASGRMETFELAVRYQFYHAFALLATGILQHTFPTLWLNYASLSTLLGVILFSGSLLAFCFTGVAAQAMITPFGGILLMLGWAFMLGGILKSMHTKKPS
jgi:uncharacterized membrane protein YgdD (TMEM256/DUF423 family)